MRPEQPTVSVIVIAFNEERRIERCLKALAAQDYQQSYEVIVVDDGSTDNTALLAEGYQPLVRVLRLGTNQGRGAARRHGVDASAARAIGFVDADIEVGPDWLRRCMESLPGRAAVGGIAVPDGDIAPLARITGATIRPVNGSMPITGNNVVFDGAVLRRTGFDETARLGEDFRLAAQLLRDGHHLERIPGLQVRHHETKSYRKSLFWLYKSGEDATNLLREHRRWRTPDTAWAATVLALIGGVLLGLRRPIWTLLGPLAMTGVSLLHTATRFRQKPLGRFLLAALMNLPLTTAYLIGRSVGAFKRGKR